MASHSQFRSLARFLYTQNPFYLISCFLILYGLQIATIAGGDLFSRSIFLTISIAAYTLLMAVTCVGVVRLGKVWEDARSILLVVIISQVALSTGLDELSITDWSTAAPLLVLTATFAFVITELTIRICRLTISLVVSALVLRDGFGLFHDADRVGSRGWQPKHHSH